MNETSQVKKSSKLRESDRKVLLDYANTLTEIASKPVSQSTSMTNSYKFA